MVRLGKVMSIIDEMAEQDNKSSENEDHDNTNLSLPNKAIQEVNIESTSS